MEIWRWKVFPPLSSQPGSRIPLEIYRPLNPLRNYLLPFRFCLKLNREAPLLKRKGVAWNFSSAGINIAWRTMYLPIFILLLSVDIFKTFISHPCVLYSTPTYFILSTSFATSSISIVFQSHFPKSILKTCSILKSLTWPYPITITNYSCCNSLQLNFPGVRYTFTSSNISTCLLSNRTTTVFSQGFVQCYIG